jgi:tetratricopeptide (TPR) repeat protein
MRSIAHRWLGNAYWQLDDFPAAELELQRSIALAADQVQLRDFGAGAGHYGIGQSCMRSGRFKEAEAELLQARSILASTMGPRHRIIALVHSELGLAQHQLGHEDDARATFAAALDIAAGDGSRQIGNATDRVNLALAQLALDEGRASDALSRLNNAVARWQPQGGAAWAMTLVDRANAESLLGQHDAALADLKRAPAHPRRAARHGLAVGAAGARRARRSARAARRRGRRGARGLHRRALGDQRQPRRAVAHTETGCARAPRSAWRAWRLPRIRPERRNSRAKPGRRSARHRKVCANDDSSNRRARSRPRHARADGRLECANNAVTSHRAEVTPDRAPASLALPAHRIRLTQNLPPATGARCASDGPISYPHH